MREKRTGTTFWGGRNLLITAALMLLMILAVSCSEDARDGEDAAISSETVEVRLTALATKTLTVTNESYTLDDSGGSDLYWTYTAVKDDSYFATGKTDGETWLSSSTDEDGNVTVSPGLPESLPGKFSVGDWVFTFNAYTSAEMSDDYLFYQGTESSVTLSSGGENTVSVTVELYEAVKDADEDGNTYGTLVVYGITFTNQDGETQTLSDITLWYSIDGGTLTEDSDEAMLASSSESGLTFEELEPGSHTFSAYVTDTSGTVLASGSASAIVKPNLTTTITGDIEEDESATTTVTLGSLSVSYGSISVSSEDGLTAALSDSEVSTVVLSEEIEISSYLSITSDTTIDLNGYTITQSSSSTHGVVVYSDDVTLVLTDSSEDGSGTIDVDYYPVYVVGDNANITIEGGTYSSDYIAVYIQGDNETITINDGTFSGPSCIAYSSSTSPDFDLTINGGTFTSTSTAAINLGTSNLESASITITGGTFSGGYYSINVNGNLTSGNDVTINISGGEFKNEVFIAGYATTTITGGTFTGTDNMQALHVKSGSISITGGTFNHADYGTDSYAATDWDYFMTGSGSMNHDEAIVIEANSNYSALTSVTLGNGFTANSGVLYVIDPDYDTSTKGEVTESISNDRSDVQQYTINDLIYKRKVSGVGTAYFTSLDKAQSFTSFDYGTPGDIMIQDSSSSTGWSAYSSEE